jgi:pimeloyl-ACP methyl ester carboxylesterase
MECYSLIMLDRVWHQLLRRPYRLHIERYGDPVLPAIVLVHGIGASGKDWQYFIPFLSKQYHCVTIDLLGHGESPKPQWCEYYTEDHITSLRYTIRRLGLKNYIYIGHSLGSLLGARYASRYSDGMNRLILLSPPVYPEVTRIRNRLARQRTSVLLALYRSTRRDFVTPELISRLAFILPPAKNIRENLETWLPALKTLEHCIEQQTILEDIRTVELPVDIWYGVLDEVVIATNVQLLATHQPHAKIHTYGGRHILTKQYAEAFALWFLGPKSRSST